MSTETATSAGATETSVIERFSSAQVWVHGVLAVSIFVLYLTGLPMTFSDHLGWLFAIFGYGNIVTLHIVAGVVMILAAVYYVLYLALTAGATGRWRLPSLPSLSNVKEAIAYFKWVVGRGEKPEAAKYNWLQKAEIWVITVEFSLLIITGLLLWFRGVFVSPEFRAMLGGHEPVADVLLLIVRDVHVLIALTALMGTTFHLYMVNVKEKYPFNDTMFKGTATAERAAHHWKKWAKDNLESVPDHPETKSPDKRTLVGVTLALMTFFMLIMLATLFASVLSPLPTREYLVALSFDPLTQGVTSIVFFIALNVAVLVLVGSLIAICYGLVKRVRGDYE
ncbi:formate dehydrogenase subunit gamma [Natronobacterium gregoryi]|uniref:Cytochrome b subunit of formate dehydrogenase n=2 Tax=Natronobacterium gregoryi TaxID=44930 RepID=L0AE19_NATGS|nr:cytochrome b/b6 domain-containing protein [Natronobacterium gregoryi]AFZ71664.1 cytochrome b subunit of formate dehydrogenase [Natronobacterium gregoryi SP2]ELY72763.1 hypothetical protein C490_02973 [Natronobacterium gregoryi SP2]PLK20286.1 hypothetical protein CYV19_10670 [Natronobacterium gregoryi SP2]SFJ24589.1 formate dehydrogenase, gamma subunit [Natronobacterium gregoryi]